MFFLGAILVPGLVLVGLTIRIVRQETELSEARIVEQRRHELEDIRRELSARLQRLKLELDHPAPPVVFVTPIENGRPLFPWTVSAPRTKSAAFAESVEGGKALEIVNGDFPAAAIAYGKSLAAAKTSAETCEARLLLGRVAIKSGQSKVAQSVYDAILERCGSETDDDGIPYRLYAAERLIHASLDASVARSAVVAEVRQNGWKSPLVLHLLRSLMDVSDPAGSVELRRSLDAQTHDAEQVTALTQSFPGLAARFESPSPATYPQSLWLSFGTEPWLVTIAHSNVRPAPLLLAVLAPSLAPSGTRFSTNISTASEPVGEEFPGLRIERQPGTPTQPHGVPVSLYAAGLILILALTLFGGYLLVRDVDRELRMGELRSYFVANVSHELKTPLTVIRIYAEMLMRRQFHEPAVIREYQQTIIDESDRLTQLVDNMLDFSKIEQDKRVYSMTPVALADVVRSAAQALRYPITQKGFELNIAIDAVPLISGDPSALEQAVQNLLTNAIKYSGKSRRIHLLLKAAAGEAAIEVQDWGIGISTDQQQRIFEKYYRVQCAETATVTGTGLGLTLVAHTVHAQGGKVAVRSAPGEGSTVTIHLPLGPGEVSV